MQLHSHGSNRRFIRPPSSVAANLTVKAIAAAGGPTASASHHSQSFAPNIPSGTLVWSDEFSNSTGAQAQPNPATWTYDTGNNGFGNQRTRKLLRMGIEHLALLHGQSQCIRGHRRLSAHRRPATVLRRLHFGAPEDAGPSAFNMAASKCAPRFLRRKVSGPPLALGNNIATVNWPACGEMDVLERVNAAETPDWNEGSVHGTGFTGDTGLGTVFNFPAGQTAAGWHTYGMIWSRATVAYYIDDPAHPYVTYTTASLSGFNGAVWPFDAGPKQLHPAQPGHRRRLARRAQLHHAVPLGNARRLRARIYELSHIGTTHCALPLQTSQLPRLPLECP